VVSLPQAGLSSVFFQRNGYRFAKHVKEQSRERRERAIASRVPPDEGNDVSPFEQKDRIDEREAQAT
jgi:hypothetical protein